MVKHKKVKDARDQNESSSKRGGNSSKRSGSKKDKTQRETKLVLTLGENYSANEINQKIDGIT